MTITLLLYHLVTNKDAFLDRDAMAADESKLTIAPREFHELTRRIRIGSGSVTVNVSFL